MLRKIYNLLISTRTMAFLVVVFFLAMAVATFIENDFGTPAARAWIYDSLWFELLMLLLAVNFVGNIFRYRMYHRDRWPVLLFHLAFLIILAGAFITRYFGYEGTMHIREGQQSDVILSEHPYLMVAVDDGKLQTVFYRRTRFNRLAPNRFYMSETFSPHPGEKHHFEIRLLQYVSHARDRFVPDPEGELFIKLVDGSSGRRKEVFLRRGDIINLNNILLSFDEPVAGAVNFVSRNGKIYLQSPMEGSIMDVRTQEALRLPADTLVPVATKNLYQLGQSLQFVITDTARGRLAKEPAPKSQEAMYPLDAVELEIKSGGETRKLWAEGIPGVEIKPAVGRVGPLNFRIRYGSRKIRLPFAVKLRDFVMGKYPGTNSPSSFESYITVLAPDTVFDYHIYMNHVLDYKGYRFFQSSYDPDEKGTVLLVNHDYWGMHITYLGYILLALGMLISLFWKGTHFDKLGKKVSRLTKSKLSVLALFLVSSYALPAQEHPATALDSNTVSARHAEKFGHLLVQDHQGRVKPVNTYSLEILRKIFKHDRFRGKTADQVILSAMTRPGFWVKQPIIKTKRHALGSKLARELHVNQDNLAPLTGFFTPQGAYKLAERVRQAQRKPKAKRNATDIELINLDEKVNVWLGALQGNMLRIYPKAGDPRHKWYSGVDDHAFTGQDTLILQMHRLYLSEVNRAMQTGDYSTADKYLKLISQYQHKLGKDIIPSERKIQLEIFYNRLNIFKILLFYYMLIGFLMLILSFVDLFVPGKSWIKYIQIVLSFFLVLGIVAHFAGLYLRWKISGHIPLSNGYEGVIFVAFVSALAGLLLSVKRSKFIEAMGTVFASFLLGIAHGSLMNPQITNLVPVLKSYWLMIHVAVITSSYALLGLSAFLGLTVLILYILRSSRNRPRLDKRIKELTYVNEMTMIIGLYMLSVGTFLGGVWASESWGRYWSWDPKEVWSLISMMVYVLVLHMRLVPGLRGQFAFNTASLFAVSTLIMTFFGVNYYLSGMHSYATGDPVPIPTWVPVTVIVFVLLTAFSYYRYRRLKD